jgi:uncharacterized protein YgiM (DUF1202 family)
MIRRTSRILSWISILAVFGGILVNAGGSLLAGDGSEVVTLVGAFRVNVRSAPEVNPTTLVDKLMAGTQLPLLAADGDWYQVMLPSEKEAWVHRDFARLDNLRDQLVVIPKRVKIREEDRTSSPIVVRAASGLILQSTAQRGEWYQVRLPHPPDAVGWIRSDLVEIRSVGASPQAVAQATEEVQEVVSASEEMSSEVGLGAVEAAQSVAEAGATEMTAAPKEDDPMALGIPAAKDGSNRVLYLSLILACALFLAVVCLGIFVFVPKAPEPRHRQAQPSGNHRA